MGKRKSSKKAAPKPKTTPLSSTFKCLFCHHDKSVSVKLDKTTMFGHLTCKVCGQRYTAPINNLSAAVDVYCDWVDACEEIRVQQPKKIRPPRAPSPSRHGAQGGVSLDYPRPTDDDADDDVDPEDLAADLNRDRGDRNGKRQPVVEDDEDEDVDEDDADDDDDRGEKRRRVAVGDYDED